MTPRTMPYLPFQDFVTALDAIAANPPANVDASCWSHFPSLSRKGRILCDAFRFLRLISADGAVLPALPALLDTKTRPQSLGRALRETYVFVNPAELRGATLGRLKELFRRNATGSSMSRKALSFYLKAATVARFELHASLMPRERQRPRKATQRRSQDAEGPAVESLVLGERLLEAGGSLTLRLEGQPFSLLTSAELELATGATLVLKQTGREATAGVSSIPRRAPASEKRRRGQEPMKRSS